MKKILNVDEWKVSFLRFNESNSEDSDFSGPEPTTSGIISRLKWIASMFNDKGEYNFSNKNIEEYALCLNKDGFKDEAYTILDFITGGNLGSTVDIKETDVLFIGNNKTYPFDPLVYKYGKLGYRSLFLYAKLAEEHNNPRAVPLLMEMVNKIPVKSHPCMVRDARIKAIRLLLKIQKAGKFSEAMEKYVNVNLEMELKTALHNLYK